MKSPTKTVLKFATLAVFVVLGATATVMAQDPRIQTKQLEALAAKATETVDVDLDEKVLGFTCKFLSSEDPDEKKAKALCTGLKGIFVKSFEFETEGQYSDADLESVRSQLRGSAWTKIVNIRSRKEGSIEVYLMYVADKITGLALLASDPKEITVVNIVGPVDLEKLSQLEGNFGVPELGLEKSKPKRKE